ncbi:MAG TPA: DUF2834 domain-containing protein [Paracoccaceae bacterium]|nr:DUF2834 domain-containing protein [Paracoccaceae bacterium]
MSRLRLTYLVLAILGGTVPVYYVGRWLAARGFDSAAIAAAWSASDAARGFGYGLAIASATLAIFIMAEVSARRDWWVLVCIPAMLVVGLAFALPFYLFLRSRPVR